ncbi:CofD-related protein, GAK system [Roseovarius tolerans]|uniref:CofD-related protein, GAK system n=1 Tax=Roseovarius tolerans TaxID=74031 RepID=A0A1H8AF65_9RHOB|nr:GAK system CofD-like protein [Roseovarius tolerans]SEM68478.1 CofD-related protein, GAK system [Roseovarius tolerans]
MSDLQIARNVHFPDTLRVTRARSLPNLGPRLLFFSGGSALNEIARALKLYTHNSIHLITPFDSGGSSQVLREAFGMPAVGDLRSRLMALADESVLGQPDIYRLFSYRFPKTASRDDLSYEFTSLMDGQHPLMQAISQPMRSLILSQLKVFATHRPKDFDLAGASIGNLILAGGYLGHDRALEPVLFLMSKMVEVQGTVRAIVDRNLDIAAELQDGTVIPTQRLITGKEVPAITSPIRKVFLSDSETRLTDEDVPLPKRNRKLIGQADLICYPPGSLFTSLIANLLPKGVGRAIAARNVPKVYFPSLGADPECHGMTLSDQVAALLAALMADAGAECPVTDLMSVVLCDRDAVEAQEATRLKTRFGLPLVRLPLRKAQDTSRYDPEKVCEALVSLT